MYLHAYVRIHLCAYTIHGRNANSLPTRLPKNDGVGPKGNTRLVKFFFLLRKVPTRIIWGTSMYLVLYVHTPVIRYQKKATTGTGISWL